MAFSTHSAFGFKDRVFRIYIFLEDIEGPEAKINRMTKRERGK